MDHKPQTIFYVAASAAIAAVLVVLYIYGLLMGMVHPNIYRLYVVPLPVDKKTMVFIASMLSLPMLPIYLYARRVYGWMQKLREQTRDFLIAFSGLVESAESYYEALLLAAKMVGKPMSILVEQMARLYKVTGSLEYAFNQAFKGVPRDVRLLLSTVITSAKTGAHVEEVVSQAADYANEFRRFSILVESRLAEYSVIASLSSVTFSFAAAIMVKLVSVLLKAKPSFITGTLPSPTIMEAAFFYAMLVMTIFSSIVVGKVIKGYTPLSSKYIFILIPLNTAIILFMTKYIPGG